MTLSLVILAAGMGSRFGGPKQLEPLGPHGELILDYAIFDARRAGFERVVLVIRPEMRDLFEQRVGARYRDRFPMQFAIQDPDRLPAGFRRPPERGKPWGTAHALLAAAAAVEGPFAISNADDFYGAAAWRAVAQFLRTPPTGTIPAAALVGFPLRSTLSAAGSVNRARCRADPEGWLQEIEEIVGIRAADSDGAYRAADGTQRTIPGQELVSMNLWAFPPSVFAAAEIEFRDFLARSGTDRQAEFPLPDLVMALIRHRRLRVRLLRGEGPWCGVTHPEDRRPVQAFLRDLAAAGEYPENLLG